jgi:ABC-2 type transport system permease protein
MNDLKVVWTLTKAFTRRFFRDKVAIFFTFLFPIIFLLVFGSIFGRNDGPNFKVSIINKSQSKFSSSFIDELKKNDVFKIDSETNFEFAREKLGRGEIDGILELPKSFGDTADNNKPSGTLLAFYDKGDETLARTLQAVLDSLLEGVNQQFISEKPPFTLKAEPLQTANLSRFDYTLAGLIGFSIMSLAIFSMSEGFTVDKKTGSLRRMQVAPIRPWQLIVSTALNRIFVGLLTVALMFVVGIIVFDFNMRGDYLSFLIFSVISTTCLFGFGMAIAGWARDANQAAPLSNLISFPMMFLSGVFFPTFLMPEMLQKITMFIPLTPVIDGLRLILTEGKTVFELGPQLAVIAGWTVIIYIVAFRVFRWE